MKKHRKLLTLGVVICLVAGLVAGIVYYKQVEEERKLSLIYIPKVVDGTNDFWTSLIQGAEMAAKEYNIKKVFVPFQNACEGSVVDGVDVLPAKNVMDVLAHIKGEKVIESVKYDFDAEEETKYGLEIAEAKEIFSNYLEHQYPNIEILGLMGMATFTDNKNQVKSEFLVLKSLFDELSTFKKLETLSMGMSDDFSLAIECGSTSVRIGSAIFGVRNY